jgi:O-antigen/teichoic acid export membrane protein
VEGQLPELLFRPSIFLVLVAVYALTGELTPPVAMALHVVASGAAFLAGVILLVRALPPEIVSHEAAFETSLWMYSIIPFTFLAGMQVINSQVGIIALGVFARNEDVGMYRVAVQGSNLVAFGLSAVNIVVAPHFSRLYHAGDLPRLQRLVTNSARGILVVTVPIGLILFIFGRQILSTVFGTAYGDSYYPLAILCVGQVANAMIGSVATLLNMSDHERKTVRGVVIAAMINVVLTLLLVPPYGMIGSSVAAVVSLTLWNIILCREVYVSMGINSTAFRLRQY